MSTDEDSSADKQKKQPPNNDVSFNEDQWTKELLHLNEWVWPILERCEPLDYKNDAFTQARLQAALKRWKYPIPPGVNENDWTWKICKEEWNTWALSMLALKEKLKKADRWSADNPGKEQILYQALANVNFSGLSFPDTVDFQGFIFPMDAWFNGAQFGKRIRKHFSFSDLERRNEYYPEEARFDGTHFTGEGRFDFAKFYNSRVKFNNSKFFGNAGFNGVGFYGSADFGNSEFNREVDFDNSLFVSKAEFTSTMFLGRAFFDKTQFNFDTSFKNSLFLAKGSFDRTQFNGSVMFGNTQFGNVEVIDTELINFSKVLFRNGANFSRCQFNCPINFSHSQFIKATNFRSCRSTVSFSFSECFFDKVPDLIDADFHQPPMLDNIDIRDPMQRHHESDALISDPRPKGFWTRLLPDTLMKMTANSDDGAKYLALRRLAIEGKDHVQELAFHPQEVRCRRFWHDKPWGLYIYEVLEQKPISKNSERLDYPIWRIVNKVEYKNFLIGEDKYDKKSHKLILRQVDKRHRPAGAARFWFGLFYEVFSNFGRSIFRPLVTWFFLVICFTFFYLSQHQENELLYERYEANFSSPLFLCPVTMVDDGRRLKWFYFCPWLEGKIRGIIQPIQAFEEKLVAGRCVKDKISSSPLVEAFSLSVKNAFVFVSSERSVTYRRSYGCLYGFNDIENRFPKVPALISFVILLQNVLSAILIFLFLVAMRNLLKLK